ncbi:hypothetical protein [Actinoplanes sp. G11-F43]|uniref:hypothetical protein n=1 Tax=Actinoplanes sp. G11-F43 TaxID=3424130 RepID=UPI003D348E66
MEPSVVLAGDITNRIDSLFNWADEQLPFFFLTLVVGFGVWLLIVTRGGIRKLVVFAIGAAFVYMLLTNVDVFGDMFESEFATQRVLGTHPAAVDGGAI